MTNATQTAVTVVEHADAPAEWRTREEIDALARRLQVMLPDSLDRPAALALAQYSAAMDANPYRGEIYAFEHRGKLVLTEGYKLLVRWARRQCNFSDRYDPLPADELPPGAIGYRCWILRDDAKDTLRILVAAGAPWRDAFEIAATSAVGIVTQAERTTRDGRPKSPPTGWTWDQVARKRALKNAINRAYGAPSPREIARESWMVDDTETIPADWTTDDASPGMSPDERARLARMHAQARTREPDARAPEEILTENHAILRGEEKIEI